MIQLAAVGAALDFLRRADREFLRSAAGRKQPDADFDQPDVGLERRDDAVGNA